mmetsp:Transcript_39535/g.58093  ORF Transcript_39535/g.58093 Transcript_39535/m.58093 type:complete len:279 (-) Transcript_39535:1621-2457(-)|eukprot:CAMPEP_0195526138 /NCGR_PEP_ID=MMETSP0794_2-20130614/27028_1 /TAXON_ID=515487 /ORGANISM="Stephanopyxis turris, Strain CCMP 815" /LENGTH=278 /DNA_ID=CAMNT_0040656761 /DNA_START=95 /DNA_END=931 /DNA_ORIENTATION=+
MTAGTNFISDEHECFCDSSHVAADDNQAPNSIMNLQKLSTKLRAILSRKEFSPMITWASDGRSWKIIHPEAFEKIVMPEYFGSHDLSSFGRMVTACGFNHFISEPNHDSYYHETFLKEARQMHKDTHRLPRKCRKFRPDKHEKPGFTNKVHLCDVTNIDNHTKYPHCQSNSFIGDKIAATSPTSDQFTQDTTTGAQETDNIKSDSIVASSEQTSNQVQIFCSEGQLKEEQGSSACLKMAIKMLRQHTRRSQQRRLFHKQLFHLNFPAVGSIQSTPNKN